jgi:hypothetical protein
MQYCRLVLLFALIQPALFAQSNFTVSVGGHGVYALPVGALHDWFQPAPGLRVTAGQRVQNDLLWEGVVEAVTFSNGNTDRLYYPSLDVTLKMYGAGLQLQYYPIADAFAVQPYVNVAALVYRWQGTRGAYVVDTVNVLRVPAQSQSDWSMGFVCGAGVEAEVIAGLSLTVAARYGVVLGELWPALALRLEGVSGFQIVECSLGLKYEIAF